MEPAPDSHLSSEDFAPAVEVTPPAGVPASLVVCEHASNRVPGPLDRLGLSPEVLQSHVAWDPGACGVARALAQRLGSVLVEGCVSRLVYDCNRPPDALSAIPARSEVYDIPGNTGLAPAARAQRVRLVYAPFRDALSAQIIRFRESLRLLVTVHSFTPVFHGIPRTVELGILHGRDARFARTMMAQMPCPGFDTRLNEPYAASDGVAHTLDLHGSANGLLNVMLEIRNDLIATPDRQTAMAAYLAEWITQTLRQSEATA